MPDRADYLANTLLARMAKPEEALLDDAAPNGNEDAMRRAELGEKILATEAGEVDGPTTQLVLAAMPVSIRKEPVPERERAEFSALLRKQVWAS
jgi:hypothetical protein